MTLMRSILLMVTLASLVLLGCKSILPQENHNPVISSLSGSTDVTAGSSTSYACEASDEDGDVLHYSWTCSSGSLSASTGKSVSWTAPSHSGTANLTVSVSDGEGGTASRSKSVSVSPITATVVDWDGAVQAGYYTYWNVSIQSGYRISGSFSVDAHDITFLILDASNYTNWRNGSSYNYLVRVQRSAGSSFSTTVGTTGAYYLILDNTYSMYTDKFAHLFAQTTSP